MRTKLSTFIKGSESICNSFSSSNDSSLSLIDLLTQFDGIQIGLNGDMNKNAIFQNVQLSIDKFKALEQIIKDLGASKQKFQTEQENINSQEAENSEQENYFKLITLLNNLINLKINCYVIKRN